MYTDGRSQEDANLPGLPGGHNRSLFFGEILLDDTTTYNTILAPTQTLLPSFQNHSVQPPSPTNSESSNLSNPGLHCLVTSIGTITPILNSSSSHPSKNKFLFGIIVCAPLLSYALSTSSNQAKLYKDLVVAVFAFLLQVSTMEKLYEAVICNQVQQVQVQIRQVQVQLRQVQGQLRQVDVMLRALCRGQGMTDDQIDELVRKDGQVGNGQNGNEENNDDRQQSLSHRHRD